MLWSNIFNFSSSGKELRTIPSWLQSCLNHHHHQLTRTGVKRWSREFLGLYSRLFCIDELMLASASTGYSGQDGEKFNGLCGSSKQWKVFMLGYFRSFNFQNRRYALKGATEVKFERMSVVEIIFWIKFLLHISCNSIGTKLQRMYGDKKKENEYFKNSKE